MWGQGFFIACGRVGIGQGITVALQSFLVFNIIGILPRCIICVTCTPNKQNS